ncbi:MAG: EamA family transporter [Actinobacteria bacterium]|nr:MAG: EamA family transporter [Actinomycetota bacterium]
MHSRRARRCRRRRASSRAAPASGRTRRRRCDRHAACPPRAPASRESVQRPRGRPRTRVRHSARAACARTGSVGTVSHRTKVWVALGTVYLIWGSTYLGIELAGETIPPLFAVGTRFVAAGLLMAAITVQRRGVHVFRVRPVELATAALVGLLLPGANAILFVAERHVPTGVSSLIIGSVPLWVVLLRTAAADRPPTRSLIGVGIGFAGLALLVRPSGGAPLWAMLIVVCSAMTWATGAFLSSRLPMPSDSFAATSIEMLVGGAILLPIGIATTHPHFADFSARSIFGWFYLVTFGSLVGYTAFVWLLDNAPLGTVATYAYVNPIVAIALGAIVLHESPTWTTGIGALLVLACVALVVRTEAIPPEAEAIGAGAAELELTRQ